MLAYYPNLVLIAAFLGLGLGCLRAGRRPLRWAWPATLLVLVIAAAALARVVFTQNAAADHLFLLYYDLPAGRAPGGGHPPADPAALRPDRRQLRAPRPDRGRAPAALPRARAAALRLRVGHRGIAGGHRGVHRPQLRAGVPDVWFAGVLVLGLVFFRQRRRDLLAYGGAAALVVVVVGASERAQQYSPYYAISTRDRAGAAGFEITANGSLHQVALPLRAERRSWPAATRGSRDGYHVPYTLAAGPIHRALVVGAGSGNDVAVLLDRGAEHVDAIEIDPVILELGRARHPDAPYASPRVRAINTDARAWLNDTRETYDLIVFGTLDSMTRLSALSTVRLDAFMYTADCLRAARARLTPAGRPRPLFHGGRAVHRPAAGRPAHGRVRRGPARGRHRPRALQPHLHGGPGLRGRGRGGAPRGRRARARAGARAGGAAERRLALPVPARARPERLLPVDDGGGGGPGPGRRLRRLPDLRRSVAGRGIDVEMFLFGLAFLLLETRSVTAMNLAWGATWLTSAVVFFAVLFMVLLATFAVRAWSPPFAADHGTPARLAAGRPRAAGIARAEVRVPARLALSVLAVGIPIFLASVGFARLFETRTEPDLAFGWNLLGAVAGGLIELVSMAVGLKALLLVAAAAYLGALLLALRPKRSDRARAAA